MGALFGILLSVLAIFLILLVLVQRGRGGGLAGALGGVGGSSAFGAKAGDVFTRITIVSAAIWIAACVAAVYWAGNRGDALSAASGDASGADSSILAPPASTESDTADAPTGPAIRPPSSTSPATDASSATPAESSQPSPNTEGESTSPGDTTE